MTALHADLKNTDYVAWRAFLHAAEHWSHRQITEYQRKKLQYIITYAYEHTSGYQKLFQTHQVHPSMFHDLHDLSLFPFVEKEMIRDALETFSVPIEGRNYTTTGGSTGIPFGFYRDPQSFPRELASKAHQYSRIGWREGDRQIVFRGLPIDTPDHTLFVPEFNELRCSSYHLVPQWIDLFVTKAWEYCPDWLRCYPSSGYLLASYLKETAQRFPPLKGILCASENLYDFQKQLLQEIFAARVFTHYGHYELAVLAGYCEYEDTYHVLPQYGYAELIGSDGKPMTELGGIGEIVATSFIMHATPFIRYKTRDFAILKGWECHSCGRPYQIWERIDGRLQELIVTHTGRYISMTSINFHDHTFDHIKQFQFHQAEIGKLTFRYIPKDTCDEQIINEIKVKLLSKIGNDIDIILQSVEQIPLTNRGKHRFLIQDLQIASGDHE